MIASYTAPGSETPEHTFAFDRRREHRLLIVPPLFDEMHTLRRLLVETMRRLDGAGVDSFLIDLPGTNESAADLAEQDADSWQRATTRAAEEFGATHVLGVRGGALFIPVHLPGWIYAPIHGTSVLKRLLRARTVASREAGREETAASLLERGKSDGLDLGGYRLGPAMIADLGRRNIPARPRLSTIAQDAIGGGGMWLRAEPGDDPEQADALAAFITMALAS